MNINTILTRIFLLLIIISGLSILVLSVDNAVYTVQEIDRYQNIKIDKYNIFMDGYEAEVHKKIDTLQTQLIIGALLIAILFISSTIILSIKKIRDIYKVRIKEIPEELICWIFAFAIWSYCFICPHDKNYSIFWAIILLAIILIQGSKILSVRNNRKFIMPKNKIVRQVNNYITAINTTILLVFSIIIYLVYKNNNNASLLLVFIASVLVLLITVFAFLLDKNIDKETKSLLNLSDECTKYSLVVLNCEESYQRKTNIPIIIIEENGLEAVYNKNTNDFMFYLMPLKNKLSSDSVYYNQMQIYKSDGKFMNINIKKYLCGFTNVYKKREMDEKNVQNDKTNLRTATWFLDEGWGSNKNIKGDRWLDLKNKDKFYVEWSIKINNEYKKFFIDLISLKVVRLSDSQKIEDYNNGIKYNKEYEEKLVKRINARFDSTNVNRNNVCEIIDQVYS